MASHAEAARGKATGALPRLGPRGHVNPMKTTPLVALLALGLLAPMTAAACPVDDALALAGAVASCALSAVDPNGGVWVHSPGGVSQTFVDTSPPCLA